LTELPNETHKVNMRSSVVRLQ